MACGPTSCAMIMTDQGMAVSIVDLAKQAGINGEGTTVDGLANAMRKNGVPSARWRSDLSIDDLATATAQGQPAIVQMELAKSRHFVIVDGITTRPQLAVGDLVAVRDPWGGTQYFVPVDEFKQRMMGWGVLTNSQR